jgi:polyhydroxyalkanoate synthesis regulator protein
MFSAAASGLTPGAPAKDDAEPPPEPKDEIAELRAQLAEVQQKLDKLGK